MSSSQRRRGGWKQGPSKPLSPAAKRQRAEWLRAHTEYLAQLLRAEFER